MTQSFYNYYDQLVLGTTTQQQLPCTVAFALAVVVVVAVAVAVSSCYRCYPSGSCCFCGKFYSAVVAASQVLLLSSHLVVTDAVAEVAVLL